MSRPRKVKDEVQQVEEAKVTEPDDAAASYEIGYGKPPAHSRFKPGQSGNPKGKPKGHKNYKQVIAAVLREKISVQTPHGKKRMTKLEVLIQTSMNNALKGDPKSIDQIFRILREHGMADEVAGVLGSATMSALRAEDRALLERHLGNGSLEQDRSEND